MAASRMRTGSILRNMDMLSDAEGEAPSAKEMRPPLGFLELLGKNNSSGSYQRRTGITFFKSSGNPAGASSYSGAPRP